MPLEFICRVGPLVLVSLGQEGWPGALGVPVRAKLVQ
jgi:hypothetical protein